MSDVIYRQRVLNVLHGYFDGMLETDTMCPKDVYNLIAIIPPALTDIKIGKWIKNGNKYTCPFCGTGFTTASEEVRTAHKYCYYCGAKMEGNDAVN